MPQSYFCWSAVLSVVPLHPWRLFTAIPSWLRLKPTSGRYHACSGQDWDCALFCAGFLLLGLNIIELVTFMQLEMFLIVVLTCTKLASPWIDTVKIFESTKGMPKGWKGHQRHHCWQTKLEATLWILWTFDF